MNTYSNLAIFLVAVLLWARGQRLGRRTDRDFGILALLIGFSSTLSHASQIRPMVFLDFAMQFVLFAYLLVLNLGRIRNDGEALFEKRWFITAGLSLIFVIPSAIEKRAGVPVFILLAVFYLSSEVVGFKKNRAQDYSLLKASLGIFSVAAFCFVLDAGEIICLPTRHFFQLHALWHALVAWSLYLLAGYCAQLSSMRRTVEPSR
jgi:predicted membrane channel-forming protein YqfA (hemolysin III family)